MTYESVNPESYPSVSGDESGQIMEPPPNTRYSINSGTVGTIPLNTQIGFHIGGGGL